MAISAPSDSRNLSNSTNVNMWDDLPKSSILGYNPDFDELELLNTALQINSWNSAFRKNAIVDNIYAKMHGGKIHYIQSKNLISNASFEYLSETKEHFLIKKHFLTSLQEVTKAHFVQDILFLQRHSSSAVNFIPREIKAERTNDDWLAILALLDDWSLLTDGWFDERSKAPSRELLDNAREFISKIVRVRLAPEAYIDPDGEVGFRWKSEKGFASISFLQDGDIVGAIRSNSDGILLEVDTPFIFWKSYFEFMRTLDKFILDL